MGVVVEAVAIGLKHLRNSFASPPPLLRFYQPCANPNGVVWKRPAGGTEDGAVSQIASLVQQCMATNSSAAQAALRALEADGCEVRAQRAAWNVPLSC